MTQSRYVEVTDDESYEDLFQRIRLCGLNGAAVSRAGRGEWGSWSISSEMDEAEAMQPGRNDGCEASSHGLRPSSSSWRRSRTTLWRMDVARSSSRWSAPEV